MVIELQFVAISAFLAWCLLSSLCSVLRPDGVGPAARLVWREHGPDGWSGWRQVHFGLTTGNHHVLDNPDVPIDADAYAELLATVLQQARAPECDTVQFAVLGAGQDRPTVTLVSEPHDVAGVPA